MAPRVVTVARIRQKSLELWLAAATLASVVAYVILAASFFPNEHGRLGHDYEYFLPLLLAGRYWIAENGLLAVPHFSPAFCGGLPFLANPQSIFYSVPQVLSFFVDPVTSFLGTTIIFAALGAVGTYAVMRRRFGASVPAALLSAIIFLFNGFLLYRMAIGHVTYHMVGLVPVLCCLLLTRFEPAPIRRRVLSRAAGTATAAAAILAYFVYAGAPNFVVPVTITCLIVWLLHGLVREPVASFWIVGAGAGVIGAALSAAKLAPALVFVLNFPRLEPMSMFPSAARAFRALLIGLFAPGAIPNFAEQHEFEYGVGMAPLILIAAGICVAIGRRSQQRPTDLGLGGAVRLAGLCLLLAVPLWLNFGGPEKAAWLKTLPYIGYNTILVRWFDVYVFPLTIGAGLLLDFVCKETINRGKLAVIGIVLTIVPAFLADRSHYAGQPYDPGRILVANQMLRDTGHVPVIVAIGGGARPQRNDPVAFGESADPCYEPIFGYLLESFPPGLKSGPLFAKSADAAHLRDPACYIYGTENRCAPGDEFTTGRARDEAAFAAYRPFAYVMPGWQRWADWMSLFGGAAIVLGLGLRSEWRMFGERRAAERQR